MISDAGQGQPGWLHGWFSFWTNLQRPEVAFFAYALAAAETLIAVAVILGFARKITYISAAVFSVLIWAVAEGFGGPYTSGASDIGTAVIYAVVFLGLLALMAYTGPLQRGLLPRAEDLVVVEGRRGRPPPPGAARSGRSGRAVGNPDAHYRSPSRASRPTRPSRANGGPMDPIGPAGPAGLAGPAGNGAKPEPATH